RRIVHLVGVSGDAQDDDSAFRSLMLLAQSLGEQQLTSDARQGMSESPIRITVVTNDMQQVTGTDRVVSGKALVLGPCKVIAQEYQNIVCRSVDVELLLPPDQSGAAEEQSAGEVVKQLLGEFAAGDDDAVVAYRGGRRWAQVFEPVHLPRVAAHTTTFREGGVYLITGGLGGVGLVLAGELARRAHAKLILVGRSAFPERSEWRSRAQAHPAHDETGAKIARLLAFEDAGAEVFYAQADVSDLDSLRAAVERGTARFGPVNGVIHAAGSPPHGLLQRKTDEDIEAALAAKVLGTKALLTLFEGAGLDFMLLCSSIRAITGGPGSSVYAAANAFLDSVAQRSGRQRIMSVNWDGWKGVGMAAHAPMQDGLRLDTDGGLSVEDGVEAFDRLVACKLPQVVVSTCDLGAVIEEARGFNIASTPVARTETRRAQLSHPRPNVSVPYVAPRNEAERLLADIWQRLLGIEPVGVDDNFFELGGDSTISIQIMAEANRAGLGLTPKQIFERQTVAELAQVATTLETARQTTNQTTDEEPHAVADFAEFGWRPEHLEELLTKVGQPTGKGSDHEQ
ncbi:MAG: SDR family NAD(P)-dependent oxidoreductase, partial [Pyrinomonadaceae bacterium]